MRTRFQLLHREADDKIYIVVKIPLVALWSTHGQQYTYRWAAHLMLVAKIQVKEMWLQL